MVRLRIGKPEDIDTRIEDPDILRAAFLQLFDSETEFPIKVEGTHTLPYFSTIKSMHWEEGYLVLKLVRPLPHELLLGAIFEFLCATGEQRYHGFLTYGGREGYLQYRFELPKFLVLSDRRISKRYPFRPRESAYVILQDAAVPGLGVAGPLVNICLGGLAMRVDRIIRLDTGVRIPPATALFDRGKPFPRIRVQELPRVHLLDVRGLTAHAHTRGTEVILGLNFTSLQPDEEASIRSALEIRDRMQRGQLSVQVESGPVVLRSGETGRFVPHAPPEPAAALPAADPEGSLLRRLRRRTAQLALVMPPGALRDTLEGLLRAKGFHRLHVTATLDELLAVVNGDPRRHPPRLAIVDLAVAHTGDAEPLEAVRSIERGMACIGAIPTVIICDAVDPTLLLSQAEHTRFQGPDLTEADVRIMDGLLDPDLTEA